MSGRCFGRIAVCTASCAVVLESRHLIEPTLQIAGRTLSVVLRNGVVDSGAPPGGMYFNVQKSRGSK